MIRSPRRSAVVRAMQDRMAQAGLVVEAERGNNNRWRRRPNQALSLQRRPNRWVAQASRIPRGDNHFANMEMISMGLRQTGKTTVPSSSPGFEKSESRASCCSNVKVFNCSVFSPSGLCFGAIDND